MSFIFNQQEQEVATDTQSIAVEHTPEGEGEELETQVEALFSPCSNYIVLQIFTPVKDPDRK